MATEQYTLEMVVGTTFKRIFRFKDESGNPIDLVGYKASIGIRRNLTCKEAFLKITSESDTPNGSSIEIDSTEGEISLEINYKETDKILNISEKQEYVWDLRLEDSYENVYIYFPSSPFIIYPASTRGG